MVYERWDSGAGATSLLFGHTSRALNQQDGLEQTTRV